MLLLKHPLHPPVLLRTAQHEWKIHLYSNINPGLFFLVHTPESPHGFPVDPENALSSVLPQYSPAFLHRVPESLLLMGQLRRHSPCADRAPLSPESGDRSAHRFLSAETTALKYPK